MKKYPVLIFFLLSFSLTAFLLLINCAENTSTENPNNVDDAFTGFNPQNPQYQSYGFESSRGEAEFSSNAPEKGNQNSLKKSSFALDREKKWGTSAPIFIDSVDTDVFDDFRLQEAPFNSWDDISEFRIYVKLKKTGSNYYGGKITINYWDYSRQNKPERTVRFESGTGDNAKYNIWFKKNDKSYFHGFFQERDGSAIVVIDRKTQVLDNPDNPNPPNLYSGSIWVMMFRTTFKGQNSCNNRDQHYVSIYNKLVSSCKTNSFNQNCHLLGYGREHLPTLSERNKKCWFISTGPFDCKTWREGNGVNTFKAVEPDGNCYMKFGEFHGLDIVKAFGVTEVSDIQVHNKK